MPPPPAIANAVRDAISHDGRICVLTGAGMSAESGVPTFRGTQHDLWSRFDPMQLATAEAWRADAALVWAWYRWRMALVRDAQPHAGHRALAEPARRTSRVTLVTQNVDDLHERAGSVVDAHVHGSLFALRCFDCGSGHEGGLPPLDPAAQRIAPMACAYCGGGIRPGVVWFGEALPDDAWQVATDAARDCMLMLVVGTSGLVHPAAGLPALARRSGATVVEINPERTALSDDVDVSWRATAGDALPLLLGA
ncbi:NAD-dependent deacylase [Luteimonas aestuarii]|uniref:NAD-dependent protein deacylase n=2 Tax=Luteimonas aestuarii TaxID=453837 RepID=A0A4R5TKR4_9GAMM|nr:NAD-dependent deacylase [Luteimonas aestuarii]